MRNKINFLPNHNPKEVIADIVDSDGSFKFRDHVTNKEILNILNWLESQGIKVIIK